MLNVRSLLFLICGPSLTFVAMTSGKEPKPATDHEYLSAIDPNGAVEKAILAVTGTKRVIHLDRLFFVSGKTSDGMFITVSLERLPGAAGIPERIMHSALLIVRDRVNGKSRLRAADAAFRLDTWNAETKSIKTEQDIIGDIDGANLDELKFTYEHIE